MRYYNKYQGFTLIELVMAIMLLGIIAAISSHIMFQGFKSYLTAQNLINANWQGQIALERMIRDIREVQSASNINVFTASEFSFTDFNGASVDYKLSGTTLTRNGQILADGISSLTFTYYDNNGGSSPTQANIHYVNIALTVTQSSTNYNLNTSVYLRDLSS